MTRDEAYNLIDHRLRAMYDDEAYAELSAALDLCFTDTELREHVKLLRDALEYANINGFCSADAFDKMEEALAATEPKT